MTRLALLLATALSAATCVSGSSDRPVRPERPLSSGETAMGYQEAVDFGTTYVTQKGHDGAEFLGAEQMWPNVWRLRYGLAPKGSGRVLEVYCDGAKREVLRSEELKLTPPPNPIPPISRPEERR